MDAMAAVSSCGQGKGPIMMSSEFDSGMLRGDERGSQASSGGRRTPLEGIFQRFGKSLPTVERVSGLLEISDFSPEEINGVLFSGRGKICVRFEARTRGPLAELHQLVEKLPANSPALALSNARLPITVSGRPWVEFNGSIVLLVRSFTMPETGGSIGEVQA